jgi:Carboxypeptidase regulatory-like domain
MKGSTPTLLVISLLTTLLCGLGYAQSDRGTITGTVTDASGSNIPGATVVATNVNTNAVSTAVTTGEGIFTIPALPPGRYKIRIEKEGFKAAEITEVNVVVGNTTPVNFTLEIGQVSEVVEVTTTLGGQVQTENAKITSQVSNKQIDELPLVVSGSVRSPFNLSLLTPETKPLGLGGVAGVGGRAEPGASRSTALRRARAASARPNGLT